ncbi:MAG TPA: non-ribosomal peptide synthetase [Pyrinomonadaceae bacterium]|jgi:amino acid adenylation domain-containing protein
MERIQKIIFEQAERSPDADAVEYNGSRLSYAELRRRSLRVSRALTRLGLEPGQAVGIYQERSLSTLPVLLGALDAGAVVVPINPNAPAKMLEWIIQTSSARLVLTDRGLEQRIAEVCGAGGVCAPVISDDLLGAGGGDDEAGASEETPAARTRGAGDDAAGDADDDAGDDADACYIIYTSGSQGRPKGVVGSHRSLVHYVRWHAEAFSVSEADRFSQIAPLSFDFSLKELLVPLVRGACVCIADRHSVVLDPEKFVAWVRESRITVLCCVPTLARSILQLPDSAVPEGAFDSVRQVLISGDMLRWDDVSAWRRRFGSSAPLYNLYGPTESTVIKLFYEIPEQRDAESVNVPVGRPIPGADVLVLGEDGEPCAPGQTGEVVILSDWLARGYAGPQTNGGAFCVITRDGRRRRAYRTGDLGRLLGSGDLELVGRKDRQVKIRGYRIELDEIESVIAEHEGVREVAVLVPDGAGDSDGAAEPVIACYFTSDAPGVTEKEVAAYARERLLPQVMSLTRFTRLGELPLSPNGKVDRLKLQGLAARDGRAPQAAEAPAGDGAPAPLVQRITALWGELLSLDSIDQKANFFELGGDSMTAIRLLRRLREEVHPAVKLGDVYAYPSVSQLSDRLERLFTEAR